MSEGELRQLLHVPLQAFGEAGSSTLAVCEIPDLANVAVRVKDLPTDGSVTVVRVSLSGTHDLAQFLHLTHAGYLGVAPEKVWPAWSEASEWDWHSRAFRRMLRTWTPRACLDVAVHPANLAFLARDEDIVVSCPAPAHQPWSEDDLGYLTARLMTPLSPDTAWQVMVALVTYLGLAELRAAAQSLRQKRLSRNGLAAVVPNNGPQPAAPPGRLLAAARRPPRGPNLRPALRRNPHFA